VQGIALYVEPVLAKPLISRNRIIARSRKSESERCLRPARRGRGVYIITQRLPSLALWKSSSTFAFSDVNPTPHE